MTIKVFAEGRLARSDLVLVVYPDTGESGDAYDIDVQTGPITGAWLEVKFPSPSVCILPLDLRAATFTMRKLIIFSGDRSGSQAGSLSVDRSTSF